MVSAIWILYSTLGQRFLPTITPASSPILKLIAVTESGFSPEFVGAIKGAPEAQTAYPNSSAKITLRFVR